MSYPKYYVTYCVMDTEARANFLGHACLLFFKQETEKSPTEVIDGIGFYPQQSSGTNPIINGIKARIGLKVDLQGSHGELKHEKIGELNGGGLNGINFVIDESKYMALKEEYEVIITTQKKVMTELDTELRGLKEPVNGYTRFNLEKRKAGTGKKPRLERFDITVSLTAKGFDSTKSYACKQFALDLLSRHEIIPEDVKKQILASAAKIAFPRFSEFPLSPLRLISTGEPEVKKSNKNEVYLSYKWKKDPLFSVLPLTIFPQKYTPVTDYKPLTQMLNQRNQIETQLREKLALNNKITEWTIQLKNVKNLALLFNNSTENQNPTLLNNRLLEANKTLDIARLSLTLDTIHYSFLLRAFSSIAMRKAVLGMLIIALAVTPLFLLPTAGVTVLTTGIGLLTASSSLFTAYQLHGFYKDEQQFARCGKHFFGDKQPVELGPLSSEQSASAARSAYR